MIIVIIWFATCIYFFLFYICIFRNKIWEYNKKLFLISLKTISLPYSLKCLNEGKRWKRGLLLFIAVYPRRICFEVVFFCILSRDWSLFKREACGQKGRKKKAFLGNGKNSWYLDFHFESRNKSSHLSITWFLGKTYIWHMILHSTECGHFYCAYSKIWSLPFF